MMTRIATSYCGMGAAPPLAFVAVVPVTDALASQHSWFWFGIWAGRNLPV